MADREIDNDPRTAASGHQVEALPGPIWGLSADSFESTHRFDAWHAAMSAWNDVCVPVHRRTKFQAVTSYWTVGQFTLTKCLASDIRLIRSDAQAAREQLENDVVIVMVEGESGSVSKGRRDTLSTGGVAFANLRDGYDFEVTSPGGARWSELICPPDLRERLDEFGSGTPRQESFQTPQSRLLGQFIIDLADRLPELNSADMPLIEQALLCLMAAARRDATRGPARLSEAAGQTVDRARAVATIARELYSARLTADRVCDLIGISRSALYRLFEADGGVASYIRKCRLDALRRDLVDPRKRHETVARLSEIHGFHSLSTLNRAFRSRFSCTPGEIRTAPSTPAIASETVRIEGVLDYLRSQPRA